MYSPGELKRGLIIDLEDAPHLVETVSSSSPTARGGNTITRVRFRNLKSGQRVDRNFRGNENLVAADVNRQPVQFLYSDTGSFHFMDSESFEQFEMRREDLEWEAQFLIEGLEGLRAMYYNEQPIALELPNTVALEVTEAMPAVKGNSATGRTKPATLETGLVVQVPEHIDQGIKVSIDTRTGEFLGRVKD